MVPVIPGLIIDSAEEWNAGAEYTMGDIPGLLPEDILAMNSICTPDTTVEEKEKLVESYTTTDWWNIDALAERIENYKNQ